MHRRPLDYAHCYSHKPRKKVVFVYTLVPLLAWTWAVLVALVALVVEVVVGAVVKRFGKGVVNELAQESVQGSVVEVIARIEPLALVGVLVGAVLASRNSDIEPAALDPHGLNEDL